VFLIANQYKADKRRNNMAKMIVGKELISIIDTGEIIAEGETKNCDAIKYDFVLDSRFLKAQYGAPIRYETLQPIDQIDAKINPGEVVYVLTKEKIHLPPDMYMQISHKRGLVDYGILTMGGSIIDPSYSGKLIFGLYNLSAKPFPLLPGRKFVSATLYRLEDAEKGNLENVPVPKPLDDFPPRLIEKIEGFAPIGLTSLEDAVKTIRDQVNNITRELKENKDSIDDIGKVIRKTREDIDENNAQIKRINESLGDLVTGLSQEVNLRKELRAEIEKDVGDKLKEVDGKIKFVKGAIWLATAFGGVLLTLLITWLAGWLQF